MVCPECMGTARRARAARAVVDVDGVVPDARDAACDAPDELTDSAVLCQLLRDLGRLPDVVAAPLHIWINRKVWKRVAKLLKDWVRDAARLAQPDAEHQNIALFTH